MRWPLWVSGWIVGLVRKDGFVLWTGVSIIDTGGGAGQFQLFLSDPERGGEDPRVPFGQEAGRV
jgi:hypothetical protein